MKIPALLAACLAITSSLPAGEFGFSETFDKGPGSTAFEHFRTFDGEPSTFPYAPREGVNDSGAVGVSPGIGAQFWTGKQATPAEINLGVLPEGSTISTSVDLKVRPESDALTVLTLGFTLNVSASALTIERGKNVAGSLYRPEGSPSFVLRMRSDSTDLETLELAPDALMEGEWYRLVLVLQKAPANGEFKYSLTLYSIGSDGQSSPAVFNDGIRDITLTGVVDNGEVLDASAARWAIDARSSFDPALKALRGIVVIDNFTLTKTP